MMKGSQGNLFDADAAAARRDSAIAGVESKHCHDASDFENCVRQMIKLGKPFTTDDVLQKFPHLESVAEKRSFGAVLIRLCREGIVTRGGYVRSTRKASHARPKQQWIPV